MIQLDFLIQLMYNFTLMAIIFSGLFKYSKSFKLLLVEDVIKENFLKLFAVNFLNFFFIFLRTLLINLEVRGSFVCYLFVLEVFFDLYIFYAFLNLFIFVKRRVCVLTGITRISSVFSDLLIWVFLSVLVFTAGMDSIDDFNFIKNLRVYYLTLQSLLSFSVFILVPRNSKVFKNIKICFFFLTFIFLGEFYTSFTLEEKVLLYEIIFSVKFFIIITLFFNFYKISFFPDSYDLTDCK